MLMLMSMMAFIFAIMIILIVVVNIFAKKSLIDREKSSPFECGFDPKSFPRSPFSLQFFLIAMIFLIFDIEISLIIPMIILLKISSLVNFSIMIMFFLFILILGLVHEWNQGSLAWAK
uniref:NADH dehydrogenase subunit 3 n=1 Tax=Rhagonycha tibetana TaxID=3027149 RepID=UPI0023D86F81|nr:NADH dehydrogenase subunit 3 [Rhagonycha tibetana]WCS40153.1 NADH dehydrogenase subunit 3 [Rhagonycha tibetana]